MSTSNYDFIIKQGATFNPTLKYSQPQFTVIPITAITKSGQAVVTAPSHGLAIDWPVWIVGVSGMVQINHRAEVLPRADKAYFSYFVDANDLRLNVDTTRFAAYVSGGELLYHPPVDLSGFTARMTIREEIDSVTPIIAMTDGGGEIILGGANGTVELLLSATVTAAFDFETAVYDLELVSGTGVVTRLLSGNIVLSKEVTY